MTFLLFHKSTEQDSWNYFLFIFIFILFIYLFIYFFFFAYISKLSNLTHVGRIGIIRNEFNFLCFERRFYGLVNLLRPCRAIQLTYSPFQARLSPLYAVIQYWCAYFRQKLITALLESMEGESNRRNYFMITLHESYMAELGFELATPGSAVRCPTDCAMEPDFIFVSKRWRITQKLSMKPFGIYTDVCISMKSQKMKLISFMLLIS